jgi:hypothetical protein
MQLRNLLILASTGLEQSCDYMCILCDRVQKVYPNLEDNTIPFNALERSNAAFMMSVLGVTCGFVIYWCLKNTVLLTLVALVFTI